MQSPDMPTMPPPPRPALVLNISLPMAKGNYLMKLCSVAGCVMANAEGRETAAERLMGTAAFVYETMPREPAKLMPVQ